jgi:hypothetical protein
MLLDQANMLAERIARYQTVKEQARHAQVFETRASQLQKSASGLSDAVAAMRALSAAGIAVKFELAGNDQIGARTEQMQKGFASDPAFIENPGFDLRFDYAAPLSGLANAVKAAALNAWQIHVDAKRERVSSEILNALRAVPEYRTIIAAVQRCQEQIERLAGSLPADVEYADQQLSALTGEQREAWLQLTGGTLPQSVILFLRASMGDGAELRLLTPEVVDWLRTRSLESAFRIKPRHAS